MILITGAGGKTGLALLRELARQGRACRALIRHEGLARVVAEAGARETHVGDLLEPNSMAAAFEGAACVYHIPPNIHPEEVAIGENVLHLSAQHRVQHFVYHSVLHPYVHAMPHHLLKAHVEERIYTSGLTFTILQPEAYMQNFLPGLETARREGVLPVPYPVESRLGMVDLNDVACAAASVLENPDHAWATYELSGGETWTPQRIAEVMSGVLNRPVRVLEVDHQTWESQATLAGMRPYEIETLLKMFDYYARHGFYGNARVLASLLGRPPKTFPSFLEEQEQAHGSRG